MSQMVDKLKKIVQRLIDHFVMSILLKRKYETSWKWESNFHIIICNKNAFYIISNKTLFQFRSNGGEHVEGM